MRLPTILCLLLAVAACDGGGGASRQAPSQPTEASFEGRTLTEWLTALKSTAERRPALVALGKFGPQDPRVVPAVARQLGDGDAAVRGVAARVLAAFGPVGMEAAEVALLTGGPLERQGAAEALAAIGPAALPALVDALGTDEEGVWTAAADALTAIGERSRPRLSEALKRGAPEVRARVLGVLARTGDIDALVVALGDDVLRETAERGLSELGERARPALEKRVMDLGAGPRARVLLSALDAARASELVKQLATRGEAAADELVAIGAPAVDAVLAGLASPQAAVRERAATVLGRIGHAAVEPVAARLAARTAAERRAAAEALYALGQPGWERLMDALGAPDEQARNAVQDLLNAMGKDALPVLAVGLAHEHERHRAAAAAHYVALGAEGLDLLAHAAETADELARYAAADALAGVGEPALAHLVRLLVAKDPDVASRATEGLSRLGDAAVPQLVQGAAGQKPVLRATSFAVLQRIGRKALVPLLRIAVEGEAGEQVVARRLLVPMAQHAVPRLRERLADSDAAIRASAARVLASLSEETPSAAAALVPVIGDDDAAVRLAAVSGLLALGRDAKPYAKELAKRLRDTDGRVRIAAAAVLLAVNDRDSRAAKVLAAAEKDKDPALRVAAVRARFRAAGSDADRAAVALRALDRKQFVEVRLAAVVHLETLRAGPDLYDAALRASQDAHTEIARRGETLLKEIVKDPWLDLRRDNPRAAFVRSVRGGRRSAHRKQVAAADLALEWLAAHQTSGGAWDCDGFKNACRLNKCTGPGEFAWDPGVTGLALLCFSANGETAASGPHKDTVRKGLEYLLRIQDSEGCFGPRLPQGYHYNHGFAALAVVDAYLVSGAEALRKPAQRAVGYVERAQNPYLAWRYGVRDGDNDTSATGIMVHVLYVAKRAGLDVDVSAFRGAMAWIDKMTEPEFGRAGYQRRGGRSQRYEHALEAFPADLQEALTGVGVSVRVWSGQDPRKNEFIEKGADLMMKKRPRWDEDAGTIDMYYWYWATNAIWQVGGERWTRWSEALHNALLENQRSAEGRDERGSWDPVGAWGFGGGRIWSTAAMCLCLQTPWRSARLFGSTKRR